MTTTVFQYRPLVLMSFFQKLFRQMPEENAVIELNNWLAQKNILEITQQDIHALNKKYSISLTSEFKLNMEEFYAVCLNYFLSDGTLSVDELSVLHHLRKVLNLSHSAISHLHEKIGEKVYRKCFEEAVQDGRVTPQEEEFLKELSVNLGLPRELTAKISHETRTAFVEHYATALINRAQLSPDEDEELKILARNLDVDISINAKLNAQLTKLKRYWALENGALHPMDIETALYQGEICYLQITGAKWFELRGAQTPATSNGLSFDFKTLKSYFLGSGVYRSERPHADKLRLVDKGTLFLTNKRIYFKGHEKNASIRLEKIVDLTPYYDAVQIKKATGKSAVLHTGEKTDIFCLMLYRLLQIS